MPTPSRSPDSPIEPQQAFLELARLDLSALSLTEVLSRVAELAQATIPGAHDVSVTLIENDKPRTVAFTGKIASALDERQYESGFGPCTDAAMSGETIAIKNTNSDDRYPDFGAVAFRSGIQSTLSVGMPTPQRVVGGLNFYATAPDAFDQAATEMAQAFAAYGGVALMNAALVDSKTTLAVHLERAMTSRAVIEQAKGILMARTGVDAEEAFSELIRLSQRANRKLNLISADLVSGTRKV